MSHLERPPVIRVREALLAAGLEDTVMELSESARTADDAAKALGCALGAIVKSLVFCVDNRFVMALVAGDHQCIEDNLPNALNLKGKVRRPQASEVKGVTGFTIGGVAPVGQMHPLPVVMDASLKRFDTVYAAAGHPNCIFPIAFADLVRVSDAIISYNIAKPVAGAESYKPPLRRSKTFSNR